MNYEEQFNRLAARAREAAIPEVDVADAVITSLRADQPAPTFEWDRPLMWAAGLSSAIAIGLALAAFMYYIQAPVDPLNEVIETVSWASLQ